MKSPRASDVSCWGSTGRYSSTLIYAHYNY